MKVVTPEISWHERDPIYSVDFQPGKWPIQRLASGGVDKIVRIWHMTIDKDGKGDFEFLSNLRRHTATVNVVRFSKDGNILATAGDDTAIILWKLSDVPTPANNIFADDDGEEDKETWVCYKNLRGHLGDVADLSWSKDNRFLVSGSVDNSAIVWDVFKGTKLAMFNEHKSYVQGVTFDPLSSFIATLSADRSLRLYNLNSKCCVHNVSKLAVPAPPPPPTPPPPTTTATDSEVSQPNTTTNQSQQGEMKPRSVRIFHDDSLRSFFRRLEFSPDGQLLLTPAGCMEVNDKVINTSFVFSRASISKPALYLPCGEKSSTVVRFNPQLFELRPVKDDDLNSSSKEGQPDWEKNKSLFCLPYRMVYAIATEDSVLLYDTQQTIPVGLLKNIHYHQISDLSWTSDGRSLMVSSTDGFCSLVTFEENELGVPYTAEQTQQAGASTKVDDVNMADVQSKTPDKDATKPVVVVDSKPAQLSSPKVESGSSVVNQDKAGGDGKTIELKSDSGVSNKEKEDLSKIDTLSIKEPVKDNSTPSKTSSLPSVVAPSSAGDASASSKGETKKKRIQLTTLSLIK